MASFGARVRRAFGPYERHVSELYRRAFIDLDDLSRCIGDWHDPRAVLEIGCGEGALAERLMRDFPQAHYTGIDIIPHLGRMYEGPTENVTFQQITAEDLAEQKPGSFDLVVINDVMHHVPDDLRPGILQAAEALLQPGGVLVFKDWVRRTNAMTFMIYFTDAYIGGDKGVRYMPMDEQRDLIESTFGKAAIRAERSIRPWSQNHAFLIAKDGPKTTTIPGHTGPTA